MGSMSLTDRVRFSYACPLAWDKLVGNDVERHCGVCAKAVTNLSALSAREADAYLATQPDAVCVRIEYDAAGRAIHRVGPTALLASAVLAAAAGAPMLAAPPFDLGAGLRETGTYPIMGQISRTEASTATTITITRQGLAVDDRVVATFPHEWSYVEMADGPETPLGRLRDRLDTRALDLRALAARHGGGSSSSRTTGRLTGS